MASVLLRCGGVAGWNDVWPTMKGAADLGREIFERSMGHFAFEQNPVIAGLGEEQLADLYLWLLEQYPPSEDPSHSGAFNMGPRDMVIWWRGAVLDRLTSRGSPAAVDAVHRLIAARPDDRVLQRAYFLALETMRRGTWAAPSIEQLARVLANANRRYVTTAEQLADVVLESMGRLQTELKASQSGTEPLWDRQRTDNARSPKNEEAFSNHVADFLRRDLGPGRGMIVNREIRLRSGQFPDIYVDALADPDSATDNWITCVIEAKGCWHDELKTAMETQLVGKYMAGSHSRNGLYIVAWFNCDKWDTSDYRCGAAKRLQKDAVQKELEALKREPDNEWAKHEGQDGRVTRRTMSDERGTMSVGCDRRVRLVERMLFRLSALSEGYRSARTM